MNNVELTNFGENIRRLRIKADLSQTKLARQIGIHPIYLNGIERGYRNVSLKNIYKIARGLKAPIPLLFQEIERKYKAVIFDFHFTIAHFYPSRGIIYRSIFNKYGFNAPPKKITKAFAKTWKKFDGAILSNILAKQKTEASMEKWWLNFHIKMFNELGLNNNKKSKLIHEDISKIIYSDPKVYQIYSDVLRILPFLKKQGIKLAIITNSHKSIKKVIEHLCLNKYFDQIVISCEVGLSKPDPKIFTYTARKIGVDPKDVIFIGDSYHTDVIGAKKAGCDIAIIDRKNNHEKKKFDCIYLNNLTQLKSLIKYE